jgi:tetratricopeptide (TPR) repeat protein
MLAVLITLALCTAALAGTLTPKDLKQVEALRDTAIERFNKGEYEKAVELLGKALKINPEDKVARKYLLIFKRQIIEPYCKQAADAYIAGNYPKAISTWENILKINSNDRRVAKLISETVIVSDNETIKALYSSANNLLDEGKLELAVAELEKILVIYPKETRAQQMLDSSRRTLIDNTIKKHYDTADEYLQKEEFDLAIEEWNKVLQLDPNQELASRLISSMQRKNLDKIYTSAQTLYTEGNYIASRDQYNRILADNPTDQKTKEIIARLTDTIKVVSQVSDEGKVWGMVRKSLYHYISENGKPKIAVAAAWYAVQLFPDNAVVLAVRDFIESRHVSVIRSMENPTQGMDIIEQYQFAALNHIYEGRYDLAIQECSMILELEPENILTLKRLGSAYFAMGKKSQARKTWQRALKLSPGDRELKGFIKQTR